MECQRRILRRGCKEDQGVTSPMPVGNGYFSEMGKVSVLLFKVVQSGATQAGASATLACYFLLLKGVIFAEETQLPL